jgi:uncharacterized protein VirK/YbjX
MSRLPVLPLPSGLPAQPAGVASSVWTRLRREVNERGVQGVWNLLALYAGVCLHYRQHQQWLTMLEREPGREAARHYPRLAYRYTLPYLSTAFDRRQRHEAMMAHYALVGDRFRPGFSAWVCQSEAELWGLDAEGHRVSVRLHGLCARSRHREGELTLSLRLDGEVLCNLSFSFVPWALVMGAPSKGPEAQATDCVPYIGRVQGEPGRFDRFRLATRLCQDTSPVDVLLRCLGGMAQALQAPLIAGVDSAHSISHQSLQSRDAGFDYASFWERLGAQPLGQGHHCLTWPAQDKPLEQIAAKHRQRTLRKRQFKQGVSQQVAERLKPWLF